MKSLNAKRIAAVAASLLMGVAVASQGVMYNNVQVINNQGQPVVQIVIGSQAKPSDGVVAANIAAVIGSLAHTSANLTAYVNTGSESSLHCVVTTPTCTLSNQEVWLGEKGLSVASGSFSFTALIGSVLNGGVLSSGNLQYTKVTGSSSLPPVSGTTYGQFVYPDQISTPTNGWPLSTSPTPPSAWEGASGGLSVLVPQSATTAGGLQFTRLRNVSGTSGWDWATRLTNSQVPGLLSSSGSTEESEYLWLAGFPIFNQSSDQFQLQDTNLAYQIVFGKPIQNKTNGAATTQAITLLGQNWTVYDMRPPVTTTWPSSSNFIVGGNVTLAEATSPLTTVYVGHNITSGPFTVALNDLSYPNSNGLSNAALNVYYDGVLTNQTSVGPQGPSQITVNYTGHKLTIQVPQTFPGLYAYQKWAKIQLYSNYYNVTSGGVFNNATNTNKWDVLLRWSTNQSTTPTTQGMFAKNVTLEGIVLYTNESINQVMSAGKSIDLINNPATWAVNFVGDTLGAPSSGSANYDQLVFGTSTTTSGDTYQNPNGDSNIQSVGASHVSMFASNGVAAFSAGGTPNVQAGNVTEPLNLFTVSSSLSGAFDISNTGTFSTPATNLQTLDYDLDGYAYAPMNVVDTAGTANLLSGSLANPGLVVQLVNGGLNGNYVSSSSQLGVSVFGEQPGSTTVTSTPVTFTAFSQNQVSSVVFSNVTGIEMTSTEALPYPGVTVNVWETSNTAAAGTSNWAGNSVLMGVLTYQGPLLLYKIPNRSNWVAPSGTSSTVTYTGENNNVNFQLVSVNPGTGTNTIAHEVFYTYNMPEITTTSLTTPQANVIIQISNQSGAGTGIAQMYYLNTTNTGQSSTTLPNAVLYESSQNNVVKATNGFRTERGSEIASVSPTSVTYDMARSIDGLQFVVGPASGSSNSISKTTKYGPYTVGQATNIANVTIAAVNATCGGAVNASHCTISGEGNLTASPSSPQAIVPVILNTNSSQSAIAVLDSDANLSGRLIVVGSKFVNSVAAQIFAQEPQLNASFASTGPDSVIATSYGANRILVAGYTANQTVQAGDEFITQLLADAK